MRCVLVTGTTGFVGSAVIPRLIERGWRVRAAMRSLPPEGMLPKGVQAAVVGEIGPSTNWEAAVDGVSAIVHLAARVHVMRDRVADPLSAFRQVNTEGTRSLTKAAERAGVQRLVFVSSIKVNGEETNAPYTERSIPLPLDAYSRSKWEAEQLLRESSIETVVVRPPLVYGPGVGGNFLRLLAWISRGVPLPLAAVKNRRSLIYVNNLADFLCTLAEHPRAANELFLVSDGIDLSTAQLIRDLARHLQKRHHLFPMPVRVLRLAGRLASRESEVSRLVSSLALDTTKARVELGWIPSTVQEEGFRETARWYAARSSLGNTVRPRGT